MICPACRQQEGRLYRRHDAATAAEHFVPRARDPERHDRLVEHLHRILWQQDHVEIHVCPACDFGFSVPWIGGDARFYALAHAGAAHYPKTRWEFDETLGILGKPPFNRPLRLVEVGAGDGAFLDQLRATRRGIEHHIIAADFDLGAVDELRRKGYTTIAGSLGDVAAATSEPFDVVCLFQTLEHMADLDDTFAQLRRLLLPDGSVFISVPNRDATDFQEATTGFWDMPPNHVGRWNASAIKQGAALRGFTAVDLRLEPLRTLARAWELAIWTVDGRAYDPSTMDARINAIASRPVRGCVKRAWALTRLPRLLVRRAGDGPRHCWAHLRLESGHC